MNYAQKQRRATRQIGRAGALATLEWDELGTIDATTRTRVNTTNRTTVRLMVLPFRLRNLSADRFEVATAILTQQRRFLMSAEGLTVTPIVGWRVLNWEGATWTINGIAPVAPDGSTVLWYSGTMTQ